MFKIVQSDRISDRRDFGALCNHLRYHECVEVGVDRGDFASHFMRQWRGNEHNGRYSLSLIDPYLPYDEMPWDRTPDMLHAVNLLTPYGDHVRWMRTTSIEAARIWKQVRDRLDFVYIDASHAYESVKSDLEAWWPLIHPDGMIAGHDFCEATPGVVDAVTEFAEAIRAAIYYTSDIVTEPSWYIWKTQPPEPPCLTTDCPPPSVPNGEPSLPTSRNGP